MKKGLFLPFLVTAFMLILSPTAYAEETNDIAYIETVNYEKDIGPPDVDVGIDLTGVNAGAVINREDVPVRKDRTYSELMTEYHNTEDELEFYSSLSANETAVLIERYEKALKQKEIVFKESVKLIEDEDIDISYDILQSAIPEDIGNEETTIITEPINEAYSDNKEYIYPIEEISIDTSIMEPATQGITEQSLEEEGIEPVIEAVGVIPTQMIEVTEPTAYGSDISDIEIVSVELDINVATDTENVNNSEVIEETHIVDDELLPYQYSDDVYLLAQLMYNEAANQGHDGLLAVAEVVMNRVESDLFPNNVHDVVYQKNQFSNSKAIKNRKPTDEMLEIAYNCYNGRLKLFNNENVLFFRNPMITSNIPASKDVDWGKYNWIGSVKEHAFYAYG